MRNSIFILALLALATFAVLPACGGGGQGLRAQAEPPLVIMTSSLPTGFTSGDAIDWEIPLDGGCGGPYVVELIAGTLPDGVGFDDAAGRHHLTGIILEDGIFNFTVKVTDTSCDPFFTTSQAFTWQIPVGALRIVAANPAIIPNATFDDPSKWENADGPDGIAGNADDNTPGFSIDALPTTVFSQFMSYTLIAAGGQGPYVCAIVDDPADPSDGDLPLGADFAPNSCSIQGTPSEVLPGGVPFRITVRVTDNLGATAERKFQWKIDTPPIIIANNALADGQAGATYSDGIQPVDGVPPFAFELVDTLPGDDGDVDTVANQYDDITYPPGFTPTVDSFTPGGVGPFALTSAGPVDVARLHATTGRVGYPAASNSGPNYGPFHSEGIEFRRVGAGAGAFAGVPRRRGTFTVNVHVYSTLVPNERGQHAFKPLSSTIAPAAPFAMNPAFTVEGEIPTTQTNDGFSTLPEAEVTVIYNPDAASHAAAGLELLATGGVPQDAKFDQPHEGDNLGIPSGELAGKYAWTGDMNADGKGDLAPNFRVYQPFGILGTVDAAAANALQRSGRRLVSLSVTDASLPLSVRPVVTNTFGVSVGPDAVFITESSVSVTASTATGSGDETQEDQKQKVRRFEVIGGNGTISDLASTDLSQGTTLPAEVGSGLTLAQLLSGATGGDPDVDLMRITVNPNGWWSDVFSMNPKAGRAATRTDKNVGYNYRQVNGYNNSGGGWHLNASAMELPLTPGVTMDEVNGVRNDGGLLYAFRSANRFGFFLIRKNAKIYVPWATTEGDTASGMAVYKFGDGDVATGANSNFQIVPMSVSPDGRVAVAKLIGTTSTSWTTMTQSSNARFVMISLTGEKFANGKTYVYLDPNTGSEGGTYLYSTSMTLTNSHLYFLTGRYTSTYGSWRDHWIHRLQYASTTTGALTADDTGSAPTAALAPGFGANWTQSGTATPMQTPFQKWDTPVSSSSGPSFATGGLTFVSFSTMREEMYLYDGSNLLENATAPVPFRVSADGHHCALLAGKASASSSGTDVMAHLCWVDSNGNGFRQISSNTARHCPQGAGRGHTLRRGPSSYRHWGAYSGPSGAFEISDDGRNVAYAYNTMGSVSATSSSNWNTAREDVIAIRKNNGGTDPWTSTTGEKLVTEKTFGGTIKWRFGSILFTADNDGLVFWGGASARDALSTSTSGQYPASRSIYYHGTYYGYDMTSGGTSTTAVVRGLMPTSAGGIGSFPTYDGTVGGSSSPFAPATPAWTSNLGYIKPMGGFVSKNRKYFYVVNYHATSGSDQSMYTLLGLNIENLAGTTTGSGHQTGRGFKPTSWPSRRGFLPGYYYQPHYALDYAYYNPAHTQGAAMQVMNDATGYVYFMSHYSRSGPSNSTTSSFSSGPQTPVYWGDYGAYGYELEAFNAEVGGPIARLTNNGSDNTYRDGHYMIVSPKGDKGSAVYGGSNSTVRYLNRERVQMVRNVRFDATTGVIDPSFDKTDSKQVFNIEASNGRAGESMAWDSGGSKLYYSFTTGSNEKGKQLVQLTFNPTTGAKTYKRVSPTQRYVVLWAGR